MITSNEPDWVGVPDRVPPEDNVNPGGSAGEPEASDQVNGGLNAPPVAVRVVALYNTWFVPVGRVTGEICISN